ncbi:MAG: hypothetical protein F4081_00675 [Dehalococcoidia bacterium]|nr:hypothetical protein [Dehalococcoidia bacterium]MYI85319.1 hypothetical protein [Dehalococcoidia bacterium]
MRVILVAALLGAAIYGAVLVTHEPPLHLRNPTPADWATVPRHLRANVKGCMLRHGAWVISVQARTTFPDGYNVSGAGFKKCREALLAVWIRERFSVGDRVYDLRVSSRTWGGREGVLAEAIGAVLFVMRSTTGSEHGFWVEAPGRVDDDLRYPLSFETDGARYWVTVTRARGDPILWKDQETVLLLRDVLIERVPEGHEHVWKGLMAK